MLTKAVEIGSIAIKKPINSNHILDFIQNMIVVH